MTQPQSGPPTQHCSGCLYFDEAALEAFYGHPVTTADDVQLGWCRRYPPRPAGPVSTYPSEREGYVLGVEWPEVQANDWCGEWKLATTT